jgi:hypothetical protein
MLGSRKNFRIYHLHQDQKIKSFFNHPVANYFQKSYFQFKYQYV